MFQLNLPRSESFTWSVKNIHTLIADPSIIEVESLTLLPNCQLRCDHRSTSLTRVINVETMLVLESMSVKTLVALLAPLQVDNLHFNCGCQVLDLQDDNPPQHQVSCNAISL